MKGTILDFLKLAAAKPELAQELVALAAKHDFEFTDEVRDEELEGVAGGFTYAEKTTEATDSVVELLQNAIEEEREFYRKVMSLQTEMADRRLQEDRPLG